MTEVDVRMGTSYTYSPWVLVCFLPCHMKSRSKDEGGLEFRLSRSANFDNTNEYGKLNNS